MTLEERAADDVQGPHFSKRVDLIVPATFFLTVFLIQSWIATLWSFHGVFDQYNVIFDTDPAEVRSAFANGWSVGDFNHPLISYYFSVPIRLVGNLASYLGLTDNEVAFREALAVYVAPLCSALKVVCLYASFRLMGLEAIQASLVAAIGALSLSAVIFGATPSSYAITGLGLALVTLLALLAYRRRGALSYASLVLSGMFAAGVTVSNIAHYGWMHWAFRTARRGAPAMSLARAVLVSAFVLIATLAVLAALSQLRGAEKSLSSFFVSGEFIERYTKDPGQQLESFIRFPERMARTVLPTIPGKTKNELAFQNNNRIKFELTYDNLDFDGVSLFLGALSVVIFGGGTVLAYRRGGTWRWFGLASAASVLTFGLLYSWFGTNAFLYSQHWQVPSLFLLGAWFSSEFFRTKLGYLLGTGLAVLLLAGDIYVLQTINTWIVQGT